MIAEIANGSLLHALASWFELCASSAARFQACLQSRAFKAVSGNFVSICWKGIDGWIGRKSLSQQPSTALLPCISIGQGSLSLGDPQECSTCHQAY